MQLTLGQAAKLAGRGKTTVTRAIQAGKLSATRHEDGSYAIDLAELSRVYKLRNVTPETVSQGRLVAHHATRHAAQERDPETVARLAELEAENRLLRELLAEVKANRDELRQDRDDWRARAERLLTDQRPAAKGVTTGTGPRRAKPEPEQQSHFVTSAQLDTPAGMEAIRRRLEARLKEGH